MIDFYLAAAGFGVGILVGITGIGGGSLMTPILLLGFGIPPLVAVSTDLLYAAITKFFGALGYSRKGLVHWHSVGFLLMGSMPGTALAFWLLGRLDSTTAAALVTQLLGLALTLTSTYILLKKPLSDYLNRRRPITLQPRPLNQNHPFAIVVCGLLVGVLVTLTSVGAGVLGTVFLLALNPSWPIQRVIATELVHAVVLTAVGGVSHWQMGHVDMVLLGLLLAGSIPGVMLGVRVAHWMPNRVLQPFIGALLLLIGIRLLLS